jgi:hypothetical protein
MIPSRGFNDLQVRMHANATRVLNTAPNLQHICIVRVTPAAARSAARAMASGGTTGVVQHAVHLPRILIGAY